MDPRTYEQEVWQRVLGTGGYAQAETEPQAILTAICDERTDSKTYRALACRVSGATRSQLLCIARDEASHAKQLETLYFLLTGCCAEVCCEEPALGCACLCALLRERYQEELRGAEGYGKAAERFPANAALYRALQSDEKRHAETLRCLLQTLL